MTHMRSAAASFQAGLSDDLAGYIGVSKSDRSQSVVLQRDALLAAGVTLERITMPEVFGP